MHRNDSSSNRDASVDACRVYRSTATLDLNTSVEDDRVTLVSPPISGNNSSADACSTPSRDTDLDGKEFIDDIANYVQSDDDVILPFLNEGDDEEDSSTSRIEYSNTDARDDMNPVQQTATQHQYHLSATFSVNMSSTTGSTAGGATVERSNIHPPEHQYDDTTTSYNTDEGYADDESERKIRAIIGGIHQQQVPPPSPLNQQQSLYPISPSNRLSTQSRSILASPSVAPPNSASLFRYLRSWGRGHNESAAAAETFANDNMNSGGGGGGGGGELTSDEEEEEVSMSQEETSWVEDDMSDSTVDGDFTNGEAWEKSVEWNSLPMLPNRFCLPRQFVPHSPCTPISMKEMTSVCPPNTVAAVSSEITAPPNYLDVSLMNSAYSLSAIEANEFVWDHGALLQSVLQLLAERDQVGVEGSMDSTENIWKKGSLKKLSFSVGRRKHQRPAVAGAWKVKYVEVRQGNLCYYEDSEKTGRKTIHLRQVDTTVQESTYRGPGFVFELLVQGSPTRHWMASSEEERQAWIKAIQAATIGDEAPRKDLDLQPYAESLEVYTALRESLQQADTQELYLDAIQAAMKELASLQVPVQWVQERIENDLSPILLGTLKPPKFGRSPQKLLKSSIADFWKNMNQTTFSINGLTVRRNSQLASERIVGALTRCILEYDKAFASTDEREYDGVETTYITELQAISYARNILLAVLRSKDRQDTAFVVRYLLENSGVMLSEQSPLDENDANPVNIEVSFAGEDLPDEFLHSEEIAAWVWTRARRKNQSSIAASVATASRKQRHTFAVLSGTVLSYYAAASPRPHGLRGQLVLRSTTAVRYDGEEVVPDIADSNNNHRGNIRHVLCIVSENHQDRLLSFENYNDAMIWKDAIQLAIDTTVNSGVQNPPRVVTTTTTSNTNNSSVPPTTLMVPAKMLKGAERAIKVAADGTIQGGIRVIKGAKDGGIRVIRGAKDGSIRVIRTATGSGFKVIRGAVGMLQRQGRIPYDESNIMGERGSSMNNARRPSFQMLFNNTIVQHEKREPTVQCVFQTTQTFLIRDRNYTEHSNGTDFIDGTSETTTTSNGGRHDDVDDVGWMSVQAKLYQAFLMSGGSSGRIARGDALVELIFVETKVEHDEDASC
jgi:PH domain